MARVIVPSEQEQEQATLLTGLGWRVIVPSEQEQKQATGNSCDTKLAEAAGNSLTPNKQKQLAIYDIKLAEQKQLAILVTPN